MKRKFKFILKPKTKPFPHQYEAINFIKNKKTVPLFDEQGLGKSKIIIDSLVYDLEKGIINSAIIICKKYLLPVWEDEIEKHTFLKSITLLGTKKDIGRSLMAFSHFYLINYDLILREKERIKMFLKTRKFAIVLDESQKIKNPNSKITKAILELGPYAVKRVIITGTPIANKPEDIWAQFYFLDGGKLLGKNFEYFKKKFGLKIPTGVLTKKMEKLRKIINNVSIRRLKNKVLKLPKKNYEDILIDIKDKQKQMYTDLRDMLYLEIKKMTGEQIIDESSNILKKLLRLTQIASNPALIDADYKEEPSKFKILDKLIKKILKRNEKTIIWTSFTKNVRVLKKRYQEYGSLMISGEIPMERRKTIVKKFQTNPNFKVLVANPAAAKEGLTLTAANNAIYFDRNFNLTDYLQSQDRIHRISQTRSCNIIKLIAKYTVDEYVDEVLFKKQKIAQFLQGDIKLVEKEKEYLNREELYRILGKKR